MSPIRRPILPPGLRFAILKRDLYRCQLCGRSAQDDPTLQLEVDHKIPRSKGGPDSRDNLWTLCWHCNRGKSDDFLTDADEVVHAPAIPTEAPRHSRTPKEPHPNPFRRLREDAGLTRAALARKARLPMATVCALENDTPFKGQINMTRLSEALGDTTHAVMDAMKYHFDTVTLPLLERQHADKEAKAAHARLRARVRRSSRR